MELKYKTQFADLEELSILGLYRRPIQRLSLTIMWIGVPIYIIIFALSKLYRYRFFDEITSVITKGTLYLVLIWIVWVIVFFLINHNNIKKIKKQLKILTDEKPYLLEEKIVKVAKKELQIQYYNHQVNVKVRYILEKNNKLYLYGENYGMVDVIPWTLFKSNEEKQLFLKTIDIPVKLIKR